MLSDSGNPRFRDFDAVIPGDVIGMKSYVDDFLDLAGVPLRIVINKLNLIPNKKLGKLW